MPQQDDLEPRPDAVFRAFVQRGRLVAIPANHAKRLTLLRWLRDECFPDDRAYPEPEVNERLGAWHDDFAMLRRYLIDAGLLTRSASGSEYRRGE